MSNRRSDCLIKERLIAKAKAEAAEAAEQASLKRQHKVCFQYLSNFINQLNISSIFHLSIRKYYESNGSIVDCVLSQQRK